MEDRDKEMIRKLFDLTLEIEGLERKIDEYRKEKHTFPPLDWQADRINKTYKMYLICKEYLYS